MYLLLHALYNFVVYGALESVTVLWRPRNYRVWYYYYY